MSEAPETIYAGFLVKQGKVVKNWKNRWFELGADQRIKYYKQSPGNKPSVAGTELGVINLRFCEKVVNGVDSDLKKWPVNDLRVCFSLVLPHRTYYFQAAHPQEALDWQTYINLYRTRDSSTGNDDGGPMDGLSESEDDDENNKDTKDEAPDTFSLLSANLMADSSIDVKRSRSVIRGRLDTYESKALSRESLNIAKMSVAGAK